MPIPHLLADFNGLFGDVLCMSHSDSAPDAEGLPVVLEAGMGVIAFEPDVDGGVPLFLVVRGVIEPSPDCLWCGGSTWVLRIDSEGVLHLTDLPDR